MGMITKHVVCNGPVDDLNAIPGTSEGQQGPHGIALQVSNWDRLEKQVKGSRKDCMPSTLIEVEHDTVEFNNTTC
jgi:hypothetical protein